MVFEQARRVRRVYGKGNLVRRQTRDANGAPVGMQQYFFSKGKLQREEQFVEPSSAGVGRSRVSSRGEWDEAGTLVADDEVLEDGSRRRR